MRDEAEAGRNLGHSFAAASSGADDSLAPGCGQDEEEQELVQVPSFYISVSKNGKVSSGGVSNISAGSNYTRTGKRQQSSASTTSSRRMTYSARTGAGTTLKLTSKAGFDSGPASVVKAARVRRRPLKQQNANVAVHANDVVESATNSYRSRSFVSSSSLTQQTSRRRSGGNGRKVPTPEKSKLRRKSPRKAAGAAASQGSVTASGLQD